MSFKDATMDHVTPLTKRGSNRSKENIVTACKPCNKAKGPLELETLGDLSPDQLWFKFQRAMELTAQRKGHFKDAVCIY